MQRTNKLYIRRRLKPSSFALRLRPVKTCTTHLPHHVNYFARFMTSVTLMQSARFQKKSIKQVLKLSALLMLLATMAACSSSTPQMNTTIQSANYLNPNIYNQASPVVITIYQLKSPSAFQKASFFALYNNPIGVLSSDLLDKRDIEIKPQQKQKLIITLSSQTNYIGVLAAFRDPDKAQWRQIIQITPNQNINIQINVASQNIDIKLK